MAAGDKTKITLTALDLHGGRVMSIPSWVDIPDGAVIIKESDTEISFVEPIADGTIGCQAVKSITTKNGLITAKGAVITPIADGTITLSAISAITTVNGIITGTTPA